MSLPASTIEQLRDEKTMGTVERYEYFDEILVPKLRAEIERQKCTIETLELENATMRRRLESLEGVT